MWLHRETVTFRPSLHQEKYVNVTKCSLTSGRTRGGIALAVLVYPLWSSDEEHHGKKRQKGEYGGEGKRGDVVLTSLPDPEDP
jgi:hypothetical protein